MNNETFVAPSARAAFRAIDDGESAVILHLDSGAYYQLNTVGARIWEILGKGRTVGGVVDALRSELASTPQDLRRDVQQFFDDLLGLDLVSIIDTTAGERPE